MEERQLKLVKSINQEPTELEADAELSPEEQAEVARFKKLTAAKAARQAMLFRIMAEMADMDQEAPAA